MALSIGATALSVLPAAGQENAPQRDSASGTFGGTAFSTMYELPHDRKLSSRFTLAEPGTVTHLAAYVDGMGVPRHSPHVIRLVIYGDDSGAPTRLLGATEPHTIPKGASGAWVRLALTTPVTLEPADYHLGVHSPTVEGAGRVGDHGVPDGMKQNVDAFLDGPSDPFGSVDLQTDRELAVTAEYAAADTEPPSPPGNQRITDTTETAITMEWDPATDNVGVAGYNVWLDGAKIASTTELSYTYTALHCATTYTVALEAYDAAGNVSDRRYATGQATTKPCTETDTEPPTAPTGLSVTSGTQTSVSLSWTPSSDNVGVAGYGRYVNGALKSSGAESSHTFSGLSCGTSYTFGVDAYDGAGNRSSRTSVTASTSGCSASPLGSDLAHLWVHPQLGGLCLRSSTPAAYDAATACASAGAAYIAANGASEGSLILVRGGLHTTPFAIAGTRVSSDRIVFDAAPGETPVFSGGWMRVGTADAPLLGPKHVTIRNLQTSEMGAGYPDPTNRFGLLVDAGSRFIRLENIIAGGFLFRGAQDVELVGGSIGPCRAAKPNPGPCESNKVDHYPGAPPPERILIDGVDFHDFNYHPTCVEAKDCHWRSMYVNGVHGLTLRNSTFRNSVFEPWTTISGHAAAARGNHNILIENNYFGANVQAGGGHGFSFAWCQNASAGVAAYRNVAFRFNSFARGMNLAVPASNNREGEANCLVENFSVYGNIFGQKHPSCGLSSVSWSYNVYTGTNTGTCGTGDVNIGGTTMPFYKNDTTNPGNRDDYALVGPTFAGDNRVPTSTGCPPLDRLGVARPADTNLCDTGAHER